MLNLYKLIFFSSLYFSPLCLRGSQKSSYFEGERLTDFGNFGLVYFDEVKSVNKKKTEESKLIIEECVESYKTIMENTYLRNALRGMVVIHGTDKFEIGPSEKNPFSGISVKINNFLIQRTKVTREEYDKFIATITDLYEKKKAGKKFFVDEKIMRKKFITEVKKTKKTKKKKIEEIEAEKLKQEEEENYKNLFNDYFKFRENLMINLTPEYIKFLKPRYDDYKDFPVAGKSFVEKYSKNDEYKKFPILFVTYLHYVEYCKWRTFAINEYLLNNLKKKDRCFVIFYPISYPEFTYVSCGGKQGRVYSCGNLNIVDKNGVCKFNVNRGVLKNDEIGIKSVQDSCENDFHVFDVSGNTRIWLGSIEDNYLVQDQKAKSDNDWRTCAFTKLLNEIPLLEGKDINDIPDREKMRMTTIGTCNDNLSKLKYGLYKNEHILEANPFISFFACAQIIRPKQYKKKKLQGKKYLL